MITFLVPLKNSYSVIGRHAGPFKGPLRPQGFQNKVFRYPWVGRLPWKQKKRTKDWPQAGGRGVIFCLGWDVFAPGFIKNLVNTLF